MTKAVFLIESKKQLVGGRETDFQLFAKSVLGT